MSHIVIQFDRSDGANNGTIVHTCATVAPVHLLQHDEGMCTDAR